MTLRRVALRDWRSLWLRDERLRSVSDEVRAGWSLKEREALTKLEETASATPSSVLDRY